MVFSKAVGSKLKPMDSKHVTWRTIPFVRNIVIGGEPDDEDDDDSDDNDDDNDEDDEDDEYDCYSEYLLSPFDTNDVSDTDMTSEGNDESVDLIR